MRANGDNLWAAPHTDLRALPVSTALFPVSAWPLGRSCRLPLQMRRWQLSKTHPRPGWWGGASDFPSLHASGLVNPASQYPGGTGASSCSVTTFSITNYIIINRSGRKLGLLGRFHNGEYHELL